MLSVVRRYTKCMAYTLLTIGLPVFEYNKATQRSFIIYVEYDYDNLKEILRAVCVSVLLFLFGDVLFIKHE